jgi:hypothetical protein
MSITAKNPDRTPIPVQLSEHEFNEFVFPHLSMPKRGPRCELGYHRLFNLILWVLYTGMQWKGLPIPKDAHGKPAIHYTNVYRAFAKWADDGSLQQAFMATGPTPWPKKGRWDWLLGLQAPEGGEGHRHNRQQWLCVVSPFCRGSQ